jgi:hypothetical protein
MVAEPPQKSLLILPGSAEFMAFDAPPVSDVVVPASDDQATTATHHDVIYPAGAVNCAVEITAASALTASDVDPERPQQADLAAIPLMDRSRKKRQWRPSAPPITAVYAGNMARPARYYASRPNTALIITVCLRPWRPCKLRTHLQGNI